MNSLQDALLLDLFLKSLILSEKTFENRSNMLERFLKIIGILIDHKLYLARFFYGEVSEWFKVHAWKACVR